ncbi:MAG: TonB family protein [Candidatus Sulfotelmatobacter sp.]|jgi:TonB family protein
MKNGRSPLLFTVGVILVAMLGPFPVLASDFKLIANSSLKADSVSAEELKKIFLEESSSLSDGTHVEPVLESDGPVHRAFLQQCLGRSSDDLQSYYRALVFTGRGSMPKELSSDAGVVAYVARTRGAIGYVSIATSTEGVKTLTLLDSKDNAQRKVIRRVKPEYPETLRRLKIGGTVRLRVTISAKGNVEEVELLGGNPILGEAAIVAVKQWVYTAGHSRELIEVSIQFDPHS